MHKKTLPSAGRVPGTSTLSLPSAAVSTNPPCCGVRQRAETLYPEGKEETHLEDLSKRSIIDMARGAIKERVDYEMTRVVENILDPNTSATAARKITITLNLKPDDTRQNIAVSCVAKSTLAATNPVTTALYVADEESIVEMVPQIPGQLAVDASEQEAPPMLKLIQTA